MSEYSPWGLVQGSYPIISGMREVSTAGHSGVLISPKLFKQMPETAKRYSAYPYQTNKGAFEGDSNWSISYIIFADKILKHAETLTDESEKFRLIRAVANAPEIARHWCWEFYEEYYNVTLDYKESYTKDEVIEAKLFANSYQSVSAYGSWHDNVPDEYVGALLVVGGRRAESQESAVWKLIPKHVYNERKSLYRSVIPFNREEVLSFSNFEVK